MSLQHKFPEGYPWTNDNTHIWYANIAYDGLGLVNYKGSGCTAFAMIASDAIFGKNPVYRYKDKNQIRVGDILRINNDTHSVIVVEDLGKYTYRVAEGNYYYSIHYGRVINLETTGFDWGFTRYPK